MGEAADHVVLGRIHVAGGGSVTDVLANLPADGTWEGAAKGFGADGRAIHFVVKGERLDPRASGRLGSILVFRDLDRQEMIKGRLLEAPQMELVEKLVRGIIHEFKGLLTIIMVCGDMENLPMVVETAERVNALTQRLALLTRRPPPKPEAADLGPILDGVNALIGYVLPPGLQFTPSEAVRLPLVRAEPAVLTRVLMHLVLNAVEAMPDRGELAVAAEEVEITPADVGSGHPVPAPGRYVAVSVRDSGPGLPGVDHERFFAPFLTSKPNGSGLGLWYARQAISAVGGVLDVAASEPGAGTTMRVFLPVA